MRLVDLNYNFECYWLTKLFDDKLPDNNLPSELVPEMRILKPITIREIENFMIEINIC